MPTPSLPSPSDLPVPPGDDADLRRYLPGLEPERQLTDWGRSERVEQLFDRTVVDFLYHYWFRCEVEGIEHVPAIGGGLLLANHAGALPPDGAMIAKAIKEEHPRPRRLHLTFGNSVRGVPFFSMLVEKLGGVSTHPANLLRLLQDEQDLVLVFPEGRPAAEKLYKDRYQVQRFGRGGAIESALRARVPIVPVCVVGAEEAAPLIAAVGRVPLLGALGYLPAKFKIRFLEPIETADLGESPWRDRRLVGDLTQTVRERIQDELHDMIGKRRSVWMG